MAFLRCSLRILTWAWQKGRTRAIANAIHSTWHQVQFRTDARQTNSAGCSIYVFGLDWACGRTCNVEKGHGPLHRPAFPRGNKSSCGRPGACQSKAIWIKAKMLNSGFDVNPQGSFQKCFKVALSSQGKSFRSAVHATTSRVLSKKESWQE